VIYVILGQELYGDHSWVAGCYSGPPGISLEALEKAFNRLWKEATKGIRGQNKKANALNLKYGWATILGKDQKARYFLSYLTKRRPPTRRIRRLRHPFRQLT
jgi:hypothetical protein